MHSKGKNQNLYFCRQSPGTKSERYDRSSSGSQRNVHRQERCAGFHGNNGGWSTEITRTPENVERDDHFIMI